MDNQGEHSAPSPIPGVPCLSGVWKLEDSVHATVRIRLTDLRRSKPLNIISWHLISCQKMSSVHVLPLLVEMAGAWGHHWEIRPYFRDSSTLLFKHLVEAGGKEEEEGMFAHSYGASADAFASPELPV